jgi:hypothetical protein
MMKKYLVLDTSTLLNGFPLFFKDYDIAFPGCTVVIPNTVLRELDGLKRATDEKIGYQARNASRMLESLLETSARVGKNEWKLGERSRLRIEFNRNNWGNNGETNNPDKRIIGLAADFASKFKKDGRAWLVSNDRNQRIEAKAHGLETLHPEKPIKLDDGSYLLTIHSGKLERTGHNSVEKLLFNILDEPIVLSVSANVERNYSGYENITAVFLSLSEGGNSLTFKDSVKELETKKVVRSDCFYQECPLEERSYGTILAGKIKLKAQIMSFHIEKNGSGDLKGNGQQGCLSLMVAVTKAEDEEIAEFKRKMEELENNERIRLEETRRERERRQLEQEQKERRLKEEKQRKNKQFTWMLLIIFASIFMLPFCLCAIESILRSIF